jgi:hypothetical protein
MNQNHFKTKQQIELELGVHLNTSFPSHNKAITPYLNYTGV